MLPVGHEVRVAALASSRTGAIRATKSKRRLWVRDIIVRDVKLIDPCQLLEFVEILIFILWINNSMVDHVVKLALFHAPALLAPNIVGIRLRLKLLSLVLLDSSEDLLGRFLLALLSGTSCSQLNGIAHVLDSSHVE